MKYQDNRLPVKIKYIKSIKKDLLRRDFTINTFCMDKNGTIIDYLKAMPDLQNKQIKTVGNPRYRLKEDALRILRAIRFATILNFEIESKTKHYLTEYAYLLKKLSFQRKKQELDKIFTSSSKERGIQLLLELSIAESLKLNNLKEVVPCDDLIGIWAQLNVDDIYPFTKSEKQQMKQIRELLELDLEDPYNLYQYGLYISTVAYQIKKKDITKLNQIMNQLPIQSQKDIKITGQEIPQILNRPPGNYIKDILLDIEKQIIYNTLSNNKQYLTTYIEKNYQERNNQTIKY